jgi:hypothetical protein
MNIKDAKSAISDLINAHIVKPNENIYVKGLHGAELMGGFDVVETDNFTGVFVLDGKGKPAVSAKVVEELRAKLGKCETLLSAAHDVMDDVHLYDTELYEEITQYFYGGGSDE